MEEQQQQQQHHYELRKRSKSRSQTPMILNEMTESENTEHHYDLRSRESRDRSVTPGDVTSSRRSSSSRSLPSSAQKTRGKIMDPINETKEEPQIEKDIENDNTVTLTVKRRSERQRVKRQLMTNGQGVVKEEEKSSNNIIEEKNSRKSITPKRTITSDYSSEEGEREDPPSRPGSAYEIYKQAGDWWNVFPKTDYTYSQTSQCRYEIAPGVLAMPNMSRPSIHSDGSNSTVGSTLSLSQQTRSTKEEATDFLDSELNDSIQQNRLNEESALYLSTMKDDDSRIVYKHTHVERFSRHRVVFGGSAPNISRFSTYSHHVDSDAELDEAVVNHKAIKYHNEKSRIVKFIQQLWNVVKILFISCFEFLRVSIFRGEKNKFASHDYSYQRYGESKWTKLWNRFDHILQYLYLILIRVLFLDSWILSRATALRKRFLARKTMLLWLILLPPLLLGGVWLFPRAKDTVLSTFSTDVLRDFIKRDTMTYPRANAEDKIENDDNYFKYEEMRRSLIILIDRFDKLEAAQANQKEHNSNINETVNELKSSEKDVLLHYEKKLSNLEEKLQRQTEKSTDPELINIKLEFKNLQNLYTELKTCCDKNPLPMAVNTPDNNLEKRVENIFTSYLGSGLLRSEIHKIVEDVTKAQSTNQHEKLEKHVENILTNYLDSGLLKSEIKKIIQDITKAQNIIQQDKIISKQSECENTNDNKLSVTDDYIRKIVMEIIKIYDADKTGRVDYALESAGGQIISIRCTQRFEVHTRAVKVMGFTLYYEGGDPRTVIQGHTLLPGVCWAFQDFPGYLLIKLRNPIKITGFTLEHAPKSILPNNEIKSAPRKFNVWGLKEENDHSPVILGEFEFIDNDQSLQYFPINNTEINDSFEYVELRIHSNHGQLEYTCLYRFRVHGVPV